MQRHEFEPVYVQLYQSYGCSQSQYTPQKKDIFFSELNLGGVTANQFRLAAEHLARENKFPPSLAELLQACKDVAGRDKIGTKAGAKPAHCRCGICPGDGYVTIFRPEWLEDLRNGGEGAGAATCCLPCSDGGFYKLASWRRAGGGDPIIAPTLPVPHGLNDGSGRGRLELLRDWAMQWMQKHSPLGKPVTSGVFARWNDGAL